MSYVPQPIATEAISLPDDLVQLTEKLAENAHDHWAVLKLAEGWTYGPTQDPAAKRHPDLMAYKHLSEEKKEYDRKAAMETLKAIIALGYRIERKE
jgi:RyR domain